METFQHFRLELQTNTPKYKQIVIVPYFFSFLHTVALTQEARGLPHTPTHLDSPGPSSELPRLVEKLPAEEEEKEEEEMMVVGGSVEGKAGWGMEDGLGYSEEVKAGGGGAVW